MLQPDIDKVNDLIQTDVKALPNLLRLEQQRLGIEHGDDGFDKITVSTRKSYGMVNRVSIKFKRTGIYSEKGAGRGYGGKKGSKWKNAKGEIKSTNPRSLGKAGTGNRKAKPWFNPVVEQFADQLAEKLADEFVEVTINRLMI